VAKDLALKAAIEAVHQAHPAYGHRRIAWQLGINHKRSQRVMALYHLRPPRRTSRHYSTRSTSRHPYTNLLKNSEKIKQPQQVWCSDLSRFVYRGSVWYLATIVDIATRQIIAHRIGKKHDSQLVLSTLQTALSSGLKSGIFHSDQGNEFMAQTCTDFLEKHQIQVSVSDVASPWQNGFQESFFGRFKQEFGDFSRFDTAGELFEAIHHHIHYYNHQRIHTALKMPPMVFAEQVFSELCLQ
jgi:putative transposase